MEDSSCGDKCPYIKMGACSTCNECPNYVESWWIQQGVTQPKLVKDCAPKRMMIQQQHMQLRIEQLSSELAEAKTLYANVAGQLQYIIASSGLAEQKGEYEKLPDSCCPASDGLLLQSDNQINH